MMDEFDWLALERWPEWALDEFAERVAIKMESGIPEKEAEEQAYLEIGKRVDR